MPGNIKRARDPDLLDALDARQRTSFEGNVSRVVHEGRDPVEPSRAGGRWDLGGYDVLYTALDPDGAIAEVEYHLSLQPVFPSRIRYALHEIHATASSVLRLETIEELVDLGVERSRYHEPLYDRTQEIGDAAAFLGFDALLVPNARWDCLNLVLLIDAIDVGAISGVGSSTPIDWATWRKTRGKRSR